MGWIPSEAAYKAWGANVAVETHSLVPMSWGYWVSPCGVEEESWAFIVKTKAIKQASDLLHRLMRKYFWPTSSVGE